MNQWWEPQHETEAVATFKLVFPPWGIGLDADQRNTSRSTWNKNHVLIEGHDEFLTVLSFVIIDDNKTLRKKHGSPPSYPIGVLPLRPGKTLYVVAGWEPEGNLGARVDEALKKIPVAQAVPEEARGKVLSLCLTGYLSTNSAFMVVVPAQWNSQEPSLEIAHHVDDRASAEFHQALGYQEEGHYDKAIHHYTQSLTLNPRHATTYINRGNCYRCQAEFDSAIGDYNKAIGLERDDPVPYNNRAHTYMKKGEFGRAIQDYNKAIVLEPNLAAVYFNRGIAWLHQQEWMKARSDLHDAAEKGFDIAGEFRDEYVSVSDFEKQHNVNVPEDIKMKLTPNEDASDRPARQPVSNQSEKDVNASEDEQNRETELDKKRLGINIHAGDRVYIPPGALQLTLRDDGSIESGGVFVSVDPWLPDLSANSSTSAGVVEAIIRNGFPVSSICGDRANVCQKSHHVRTLLAHPEASRLRHIAVLDGNSAVGVLDLDRARGEVNHHDPDQRLLVGGICEPLNQENCLRGDSPLMEYILTADDRPFRMVQLANGTLGTVDVEDLQKLPVRILLFTKFSHLETLLARKLCTSRPQLLDILRTAEGPVASSLGGLGAGPERRIERLKFRDLLRKANEDSLIGVNGEEIEFLVRYRNNVAHGPRWYITRRQEVTALVNCVKRISDLINELDAIPSQL